MKSMDRHMSFPNSYPRLSCYADIIKQTDNIMDQTIGGLTSCGICDNALLKIIQMGGVHSMVFRKL